jgi:methylated-DNA-[protein]-cysteine S-methyltransferase
VSITLDTPIGPFTMLLRGETVLASGFTDDETALWPQVHPALHGPADADPTRAVKAVAAYFDGDLAALDTVDVLQRSDGAFLGPAWETLRQVSPGAPITYTEYARRCGRPAAVRAAAQACARNAAALFVPCHRVLRSDGSLGGFRWGLDVKRTLIAHEAASETRS